MPELELDAWHVRTCMLFDALLELQRRAESTKFQPMQYDSSKGGVIVLRVDCFCLGLIHNPDAARF